MHLALLPTHPLPAWYNLNTLHCVIWESQTEMCVLGNLQSSALDSGYTDICVHLQCVLAGYYTSLNLQSCHSKPTSDTLLYKTAQCSRWWWWVNDCKIRLPDGCVALSFSLICCLLHFGPAYLAMYASQHGKWQRKWQKWQRWQKWHGKAGLRS